MTTLPAAAVATSRLLVVEDDDSIRETVGEALRSEGYEVLTCADGAEALQLISGGQPEQVDLLVLDLMLPGLGGLDLCRELRRFNNHTPILVISARDSETDRVLGLEVGADDYLVKPFGLRELVARCRALLRRSRQSPAQFLESITHANLCLYINECRVTRDGTDLNLFAQPTDVHIDCFGVTNKIDAPDLFKQLITTPHTLGMLDEQLQNLVLLR